MNQHGIERLPTDVIEMVVRRLAVHDRARFRTVLPKSVGVRVRKTPAVDKRLGVLWRSIHRRRTTDLSAMVVDFLITKVSFDDPTLLDIAEAIPEKRALITEFIHTAGTKIAGSSMLSMLSKMTPDQIKAMPAQAILKAIASASVSDLPALLHHPTMRTGLTLRVCIAENVPLFDHIATHRLIDLAPARTFLRFLSTPDSFRAVLRHFELSDDERLDMYKYAIDCMNTDCALVLDF